MNIAVAGGTGFLGRHIVHSLLEARHDATVLSRDPRKVQALPQLVGARAAPADVLDPRSLGDALRGAQATVMAVQFPNYPMEQPRRGLTFDRYDRQGTENVVRACTDVGVESFVYISGVGANASSDKSWYRAKGRAEQTIAASGLRYAILRPSWAYGPGDRALNRFRSIARFSPLVPKPGTRVQRIQPVYVEDIALAVRRIFERDAYQRTYEIGGPEVLTMEQVMRTLFEVMGVRRAILPLPARLLQLATAPLVVLPKPPLTPAGVEFAVQDGLADAAPLRRDLGVEPVPLREGLARYIV